MIRRRIAAALIAVTLLLGLGHALTPGYHSAGEVVTAGELEWDENG